MSIVSEDVVLMKMVAATNNNGKLAELVSILSKMGIEVISLKEAGFDGEIEESGRTFEENAHQGGDGDAGDRPCSHRGRLGAKSTPER